MGSYFCGMLVFRGHNLSMHSLFMHGSDGTNQVQSITLNSTKQIKGTFQVLTELD